MKFIKTEQELREFIDEVIQLKKLEEMRWLKCSNPLANVYNEIGEDKYNFDQILNHLCKKLKEDFSVEIENIERFPLHMRMDLIIFTRNTPIVVTKILKDSLLTEKKQELEKDPDAIVIMICMLLLNKEYKLTLEWIKYIYQNIDTFLYEVHDLEVIKRMLKYDLVFVMSRIQAVLNGGDEKKEEKIKINLELMLSLRTAKGQNSEEKKKIRESAPELLEIYELLSEIIKKVK